MTASIRIGTRASALALSQTQTVADALAATAGGAVELVPITSHGDVSTASLATLGGTGAFATALREALLADQCDLLVHSLKDLPTAPCPGLVIAAVPERADARDAVCARDGLTLESLPAGARVGTGSPRRIAQVKARRSDLEVVDIRGNVDSRLAKVADGELDAVVLAAAGLTRLGRTDAITQLLELADWPTAPGQGALAVEAREGAGQDLRKALRALTDAPARATAHAERTVLARLEAGCAAPLGATAMIEDGMLFLTASVYSLDGAQRLDSSHAATLGSQKEADLMAAAEEVGGRVADELLAHGAARLAPLGR